MHFKNSSLLACDPRAKAPCPSGPCRPAGSDPGRRRLVASDLDDHTKDSLLSYARLIGLAFQVQDDILDVEGSSEQLGKPAGSDIALGKNTFPAKLGLEGAKAELGKLHENALQALASLPYNTDSLIAFSELLVNRNH